MNNHDSAEGIIMGALIGLVLWGIIITVGAAL